MPERITPHTLIVSKVIRRTASAVSIELLCQREIREFSFKPGQYISLEVSCTGKHYVRCYSLSSAPCENRLEITVKAINGGRISNYLQGALVGDRFLSSLAMGDFSNQGDDGDFHAVAAGSGITPIFSMLKESLLTSDKKCNLLYITKRADDTIFLPELKRYTALYPSRLSVHFWHTQTDHTFDPTIAIRYLHQMAGDIPKAIYLCGPSGFMNVMEDNIHNRFNETRIFKENFCVFSEAASVIRKEKHHVSLKLKQVLTDIEVLAGESLLSGAMRNNLEVPYGCMLGKCGSCMARLITGEVVSHPTNFLSEQDVKDGYLLCCQSSPISDCEIVFE